MQFPQTTRFRTSMRAALLCAALLCAALPLALLSMATPSLFAQGRTIYPDPSVADTQIHDALARARASHKNVILDFGGNWCGDCQVLDLYFHDATNKALLTANYELVDVNVGHLDANQKIAEQYGIPLKRGVPALVVLSAHGKVLYAQANGEFEKMAQLQSSDLTKFLNDWKPSGAGGRGGR